MAELETKLDFQNPVNLIICIDEIVMPAVKAADANITVKSGLVYSSSQGLGRRRNYLPIPPSLSETVSKFAFDVSPHLPAPKDLEQPDAPGLMLILNTNLLASPEPDILSIELCGPDLEAPFARTVMAKLKEAYQKYLSS